ncbi:MAG: ABC transporter permease [Gemmatimonadales bacterium]
MRRRAWGLPAYYLGLLGLLYLPILVLLVFAFNDGTILAFPLRGFTLRWFTELFATEALMRALRNSVVVAAGSSLLATALATCGAIACVRFAFRGKGLFLTAALLPLYVPFVVLGVALLLFFSSVGIPRSLLMIAGAHTVIGFPYALLILVARLVGFDRHLEEAAMSLGATYWQMLRQIVLPLIAPAMFAAWLTAFTVSFDEFAVANMLAGREPTLPVYLYSQLRMTARLPRVIAMAALIMAITLTIFFMLVWLRRLVFRSAAAPRAAGLPAEAP